MCFSVSSFSRWNFIFPLAVHSLVCHILIHTTLSRTYTRTIWLAGWLTVLDVSNLFSNRHTVKLRTSSSFSMCIIQNPFSIWLYVVYPNDQTTQQKRSSHWEIDLYICTYYLQYTLNKSHFPKEHSYTKGYTTNYRISIFTFRRSNIKKHTEERYWFLIICEHIKKNFFFLNINFFPISVFHVYEIFINSDWETRFHNNNNISSVFNLCLKFYFMAKAI